MTAATRDDGSRPRPPRVLLRVEEAAEMLSIGRCRVFDLINSGQLVSVKIGASPKLRGL